MVNRSLGSEPDYSGVKIRGAKTGPRRELTLRIEIWPKRKATFGGGNLLSLRFGAIFNYEEVRRFFMRVPLDALDYLRELSESNPRRHVIEMELDRTGERIRIISGKVSKPAPMSTAMRDLKRPNHERSI
jgi:hypothetical protein